MKISGFPGFDAAVAGSTLVRARVTDLTAQVASGLRAQTFAGLGGDASLVLDLRSERARRETFASAARRGEAFAEAAQNALGAIRGAARDILDKAPSLLLSGLPGSDELTVRTMAETARASLKTIVGLLGERFAGDALFGGAAPDQAPIVSAAVIETTGLFTQIRTEVQTLAPGNGSTILANTKALAESNVVGVSPFRGFAAEAASGLWTDSRRSVPVGEGVTISVGMYAYKNAASISQGQTTGAWSRDLMWSLSVIANLEPPSPAALTDYRILVQGVIDALKSGVNALIEDEAALGVEQSRLSVAAERNENVALQLDIQVGKLESVDSSEAITQLTSSKTLLEASYRAMVIVGDLSLTKFLR
ncbi:MAG: flagellin [Roseomonas sp.]|nr:flagellin [Roseomonas sp.]